MGTRLLPKNGDVMQLRPRRHDRTVIHLVAQSATRSFEPGTPLWFDTDAIIDGATNALLAAEVTLSGLYGNMSE